MMTGSSPSISSTPISSSAPSKAGPMSIVKSSSMATRLTAVRVACQMRISNLVPPRRATDAHVDNIRCLKRVCQGRLSIPSPARDPLTVMAPVSTTLAVPRTLRASVELRRARPPRPRTADHPALGPIADGRARRFWHGQMYSTAGVGADELYGLMLQCPRTSPARPGGYCSTRLGTPSA